MGCPDSEVKRSFHGIILFTKRPSKTPTVPSGPVGTTLGPDGNIWFTEATAGKIGILNPFDPTAAIVFITINDVSVAEGNSGTTNATFTVSLSATSGNTVQVNFATADGTAVAGSDYQATSGTLTFMPGQTTKTINVPVFGDGSFEPDETFFVNLSGAVAATIQDSQGQGTIINDDLGGTLQFSQPAYAVAENAGSATITVTRTDSTLGTVTVNFATSNGTATAGLDYGSTAGTLTFGPGVTSQSFNVPILDDTLTEGIETVNLTLSAPTGGGTLGLQITVLCRRSSSVLFQSLGCKPARMS